MICDCDNRRPGVYLCTEIRLGQCLPGPLWLGDQAAVRQFFRKLLSDGFEIAATTANRAVLTAPGVPRRFVWLESHTGAALRVSSFLP